MKKKRKQTTHDGRKITVDKSPRCEEQMQAFLVSNKGNINGDNFHIP
jgi:hypothetical protein